MKTKVPVAGIASGLMMAIGTGLMFLGPSGALTGGLVLGTADSGTVNTPKSQMGNDKTMGVAILNNTNFQITCGDSMGATEKYANDIMPGEIWYRHIGAVWVTLFAMPTTDKTRY